MSSRRFGRHSGQAAFIGVAAALILAAAALGAIGWCAYVEVSAQAERYGNYKALQRDAGKADSLSTRYASILKDLDGIRKALPAQNQGTYVLNILVEEARRMDLGIAGITALDEIPFPGYKELPFEVGLTGGFRNLVRYLHALETRGMVLQVRKLNARAEAINKSRVIARLELSVLVPGHTAPEPGSAGSIPAAMEPAPSPPPAQEAAGP